MPPKVAPPEFSNDAGGFGRKIPDEHLREVCKFGQKAACCRYILLGHEGFECAKDGPMSTFIDSRVKDGTMVAAGDNCPGIWTINEAGNVPAWIGMMIASLWICPLVFVLSGSLALSVAAGAMAIWLVWRMAGV